MIKHIVKAYDDELKALHALIGHMGELTLSQINNAIKSVMAFDVDLAQELIARDREVNLLETKVDELAVRILALRQPVAYDLRTVVASLKISNQVERIADYASNIAKFTLALKDLPSFPEIKELPILIKMPEQMFQSALIAFETSDINLALKVWHMDQEVDVYYKAYLQKIFEAMIDDPKNVGAYTQLLFAAKNIERIGDQSQNIAEAVYTMITGKPFQESDMLKNAHPI